MCWICGLSWQFVKFNAYIKHFVSLSIASFMLVTVIVEFDIFRLQIGNLFSFLFRVVFFAFFDAMLDENWVDSSPTKSIFFDTNSIFSIEASKFSNAFNVLFVEFKLKILFVGVEVVVPDDPKYFELGSFISFKIWPVEELDNFERILSDLDNDCSDDSDGSRDSLGVLMLIRCIFTSILGPLTFIDVFLIISSEGTTLSNLVITI